MSARISSAVLVQTKGMYALSVMRGHELIDDLFEGFENAHAATHPAPQSHRRQFYADRSVAAAGLCQVDRGALNVVTS